VSERMENLAGTPRAVDLIAGSRVGSGEDAF
jgi:hypothetical protein